MKIVAVTACPTGIAHTYMAAEQLEKTAKKLGHTIKVETQGAMGIENELTQADMDAADGVHHGRGHRHRTRAERFDRIRKIQVPVQAALKNPEAIFAKLESPFIMPLKHHFICPLPNGVHARPASALEEVVREFHLGSDPAQPAHAAAWPTAKAFCPSSARTSGTTTPAFSRSAARTNARRWRR